METVGAATWSHSVQVAQARRHIGRCRARPAATGRSAELTRVFFLQPRWSARRWAPATSSQRLARFCADGDVRPLISSTLPLSDAREGFAAMAGGELFGKIVFTI